MARLGEDNSKSTIRQFFSSITCITCGEQTNKEVCPECLSQPSRTILILLQKIRQLERNQQQITAVRIRKKNITGKCIVKTELLNLVFTLNFQSIFYNSV